MSDADNSSTEKFSQTLQVLEAFVKELSMRGDAGPEDKIRWSPEAAATLVLAAVVHRSTAKIEHVLMEIDQSLHLTSERVS